MGISFNNLNGTADNQCKCDSWIEHYKNFSDGQPIICSVVKCDGFATYGGHVQKANAKDNHWYIVPLCRHCNTRKNQELALENNTDLVSANVSKTCGNF